MVRAQRLADKYFASILMGHFAGLLLLFNMPTLLAPAVSTTSHNTIPNLFTRYLATFVHVKKWYSGDPFNSKSQSCASLKKVNLLHKVVYKKVNNNDLLKDMNDNQVYARRLFMTQYDMVLTQWAIIAPIVLFPTKFGLYHLNKKDLESLIHFWRVIGYCLGIEDRFNICDDNNSYESTHYLCKVIYDKDFYPACAQKLPDVPTFGLNVSLALAKAMNCMAPMLSFAGFLRYVYKYVLEIPDVYIEVKDRKGYRNIVYLITVIMKYDFMHHVISWFLSLALCLVSWREKKIHSHYEKKYGHINYYEEYKECPIAQKWMY